LTSALLLKYRSGFASALSRAGARIFASVSSLSLCLGRARRGFYTLYCNQFDRERRPMM
jgi:hypothetical protein